MPERTGRVAGAVRLLATAVLAVFVVAAVLTADPPEQDRAEAIGSRIRCPVCQGEPIADSPSGLARDMMGLVRQRIAEGYTDQQIVDELLRSYTGAQLLDPPLTAATVALWAVPALVVVAGAIALAGRLRPRGVRQPDRPGGERRELARPAARREEP